MDRPCKVSKSKILNEIWLNNEGLFVAVKIQNVSAAMKEDSSWVKKIFINTLTVSMKPTSRPYYTSLITTTEESAPFCGQSEVTLSIGSNVYDHNLVVANITNDDILGLDFLE